MKIWFESVEKAEKCSKIVRNSIQIKIPKPQNFFFWVIFEVLARSWSYFCRLMLHQIFRKGYFCLFSTIFGSKSSFSSHISDFAIVKKLKKSENSKIENHRILRIQLYFDSVRGKRRLTHLRDSIRFLAKCKRVQFFSCSVTFGRLNFFPGTIISWRANFLPLVSALQKSYLKKLPCFERRVEHFPLFCRMKFQTKTAVVFFLKNKINKNLSNRRKVERYPPV